MSTHTQVPEPGELSYGTTFARIYDSFVGGYSRMFAPQLVAHYAARQPSDQSRRVLDICCGTGAAAGYFLDRGYSVTGLDLAPAMLRVARQRLRPFLESGRARLVLADARSFDVGRGFGLAYSIFDSLNHLSDEGALASCFRSVARAVVPGGEFVFDLLTRKGLAELSTYTIHRQDGGMFGANIVFDGAEGHALVRADGFLPVDDGHFERFSSTHQETGFRGDSVLRLLRGSGWNVARVARLSDLDGSVDDLEAEARLVFFAVRAQGRIPSSPPRPRMGTPRPRSPR